MSTENVEKLIKWEFYRGVVAIPYAGAGGEPDENCGILRCKVPGGWLVATVKGGGEEMSESRHYEPAGVCFVTDPNYTWNL